MDSVRPWLERRIIAYAHQAGAMEAPASTLYGIELALANGATGIEIDVHGSLDGVVMVAHDPVVETSTDGSGAIAELAYDDLRALDHAFLFQPPGAPESDAFPFRGRAPKDHRFAIATLDEVLESTGEAFVNIDLKSGAPAVAPYERAVAEAIARHACAGRVIVTSFDDHRTGLFAAIAPGVGTSPGVTGLATFVQAVRMGTEPPPLPAHHVALQVPYTFGGTKVVDERLVEEAHRAGLALHVWTVNDPNAMEELVELGVDGIMSDVPSALVTLLKKTGEGYLS